MSFKNVIVKRPCPSMVDGITSASLGKPDYEKALKQHDNYIKALKKCGVEVTVMEADNLFPDSCFIEDTAVLTKNVAIISNPGAKSRNGETVKVEEVLKKFYKNIERIKAPGTLDGGDIMMVGEHFYIGKSDRTNDEGCRQFIEILEKNGHTGSQVPLKEVLHLKTGVNYLENNNMMVAGEFITNPTFSKYNHVIVPADESYAANCIWVNDTVIVPEGYPKVQNSIEKLGYKVITVDTSEYKKLDGGLSCLSLRF